MPSGSVLPQSLAKTTNAVSAMAMNKAAGIPLSDTASTMYFPSPHNSTRGENLAASIINDGFGASNFYVGGGLGMARPMKYS